MFAFRNKIDKETKLLFQVNAQYRQHVRIHFPQFLPSIGHRRPSLLSRCLARGKKTTSASYLLDAKGVIVAKNLRGPALEAELDKLVKK